MSSHPTKTKALVLLLFSLIGLALTYGTMVLLARTLSADGYDDYAVAIATVTILTTLAELGFGKYAMRSLPAYVTGQRWQLAAGYWRFATVTVLATSVILASFVALGEAAEGNQFGDYAVGIMILFLPVMALLGLGADLAMAYYAPVRATLVTRLLVPGTTLVIAGAWLTTGGDLTAPRATLCYASGSLAGLIAILRLNWRIMPKQIADATPTYELWEWFIRALPFLYFALLISLLSKVGVLVLELVCPEEAQVAIFAVALDTGMSIYLVAKSTDKLFLPEISVLIELQETAQMFRLRSRRMVVMLGICAIYLAMILLFGRNILSMFGDEFVEGYRALCLIALASSVWTIFSLSPLYLNYIQKEAFVVGATAIAVVLGVALCAVLGGTYGATGGAVAYAVSVSLLYITFAFVAYRNLRKRGQGKNTCA